MSLEITGKLIAKLPEKRGTGRNGEWVKQEFVLETEDQYPKKICCSVWGDKVQALSQLNEGDQIKAGINIESREYNERWYTDVRAWRLEVVGQAAGAGESFGDASGGGDEFFGDPDQSDDLPF